MATTMAANRPVHFALRALQLIFAIIVIGTDGYAIHVFRGHEVYEQFVYGNFYDYYGVPDAWGFLMFCAGWTFLGVIFLLIAGNRFADHRLIGYIRVAVEAVALLSWTAGFIASAINIGTNACPAQENHCRAITAATVFGALEMLLFVITTTLTFKLVFNGTRGRKTSKTSSDIPI
ncbi:marvel domain-containing protein [Penicillium cinerascens]|uniref:Marvel domain-containing protein n=1 Tax=Penicillium cinerascens TaxID=70096 RepID=A0A9W9TDG2_9EURO|nr:marvel domain-containing protein [Penicillium cinerascens]KAJ5218762.1 marvel domain-containing protein [Penicillium cinerascens]